MPTATVIRQPTDTLPEVGDVERIIEKLPPIPEGADDPMLSLEVPEAVLTLAAGGHGSLGRGVAQMGQNFQ